MPGGAAEAIRAWIRSATSIDQVGWPRWSSTTWTCACSRSFLIMVATKLGPWAPYSQAVRTT